MRIVPLRVWFSNAMQQSAAYARRVGTMIGRKIRDAGGAIGRGVGVGDDESEFGGGRSRAWIQEVVEDAKKKLLTLFEKSFFERFPRFQKHMRRLLGSPEKPIPQLPAEKKPTAPVKLGAHTPTSEEAAAFRRQIEQGMRDAHTREHAGLRDTMDRRRRRRRDDPEDEEEESEADYS